MPEFVGDAFCVVMLIWVMLALFVREDMVASLEDGEVEASELKEICRVSKLQLVVPGMGPLVVVIGT